MLNLLKNRLKTAKNSQNRPFLAYFRRILGLFGGQTSGKVRHYQGKAVVKSGPTEAYLGVMWALT